MTEVADKEPEWVRLEDLDPEQIDDEFGDMIIEQRLLVNNTDALERITDDIRLDDLPWDETLTVTSEKPLAIMDAFDDLKREEAFYNQALEAIRQAKEQHPDIFSIPENFAAPMLKDDEYMKQVYQKLVTEAKEGNEEAAYRLQAFEKQRKKAARMNEHQKMLSRKRKEMKEEREARDQFNEEDYDVDAEPQIDEPEPVGKNKKKNMKNAKKPRIKYTKEARDQKYGLGSRARAKNKKKF
ncbi:eukaryotic rRNA processing [Sporodiniella umbellata]|nr:eukaryotic rRNA processing [Sporodiniella umbellata]